MQSLPEAAPAFVEMAHRIVWCSAATVGPDGGPRSRILHPLWNWDGEQLIGWIGTGQTPVKAAHIAANPLMSLSYWAPNHDTCTAECRATWVTDVDTRRWLWDAYKTAPAPLGYDPAIIPGWDSAESEGFLALRLDPVRLRVFPGTLLLGAGGELITWHAP